MISWTSQFFLGMLYDLGLLFAPCQWRAEFYSSWLILNQVGFESAASQVSAFLCLAHKHFWDIWGVLWWKIGLLLCICFLQTVGSFANETRGNSQMLFLTVWLVTCGLTDLAWWDELCPIDCVVKAPLVSLELSLSKTWIISAKTDLPALGLRISKWEVADLDWSVVDVLSSFCKEDIGILCHLIGDVGIPGLIANSRWRCIRAHQMCPFKGNDCLPQTPVNQILGNWWFPL